MTKPKKKKKAQSRVPWKHGCCSLLALGLFSVDTLLPLQAPPVPGWSLPVGQILVGGLHSRRAGSCGCEIVWQALLAEVTVAAGVLLDGGHTQAPGAVRGGAAALAEGQGTADGRGVGSELDLLLLLLLRGQGEGRCPAGAGKGRRRRLDDAHGRRLEVAQHFVTLKSREKCWMA